MPITRRSELRPGMRVQVVEKQNQGTGALTEGIISRLLTKSPNHPRGIKVMLEDGTVGRVQAIMDGKTETPGKSSNCGGPGTSSARSPRCAWPMRASS